MYAHLFNTDGEEDKFIRTSKDWRALRRALFLVSIIISILLGLNTAFLEWVQYSNYREANERSFDVFSHQVDATLSVFEYSTAAALAEAYLKRDEVNGVAVFDSYGFEVVKVGSDPLEKTVAGNDTIVSSKGITENGYVVSAVNKTDIWGMVFNVILQAVLTFLIAFIVLMVLLGDVVRRFFAAPIMNLGDAMVRTRTTGNHVEVKMEDNTEVGRLAKIFNEMQRESARRREELKAALQEAAKASEAKSTFLANMSHELRSPLNAIIGFSQMLVMRDMYFGTKVNEKITEYATCIESSGSHLLQIVNSMLDLTRIENANFTLQPELFCASDLFNNITALFHFEDCSSWITIESKDEGGGEEIFADLTVLRQVIVNLVTNAKLHNAPGTLVKVTLVTRAENTELTVNDNGIGMSEEDIQHVLQPFSRLNNPLIADSGGVGLGLPLSHSLIKQHGGTFEIESVVDEGTTIRISIPGPKYAIASDVQKPNEQLENIRAA